MPVPSGETTRGQREWPRARVEEVEASRQYQLDFDGLRQTGDDQAVAAVMEKSEPRVARPRRDPSGVVPDDSRNASPVAAPDESHASSVRRARRLR